MGNNLEHTMQFNFNNDKKDLTKAILTDVYKALEEKGYNPVNQLVGYLISGDPTYITNYNGARALVRKLERDEILEEVMKTYLEIK
ncbi:MAG: IreB family regulatory phosphoprotein [Sarcina sp.]